MYLLRLLRRRHLTRAYRPDGFVRDDNLGTPRRVLPVVDLVRHRAELREDDLQRLPAFPLLQRLADAHDHVEAVIPGVRHLFAHRGVILAQQSPALRVAYDDPRDVQILQHLGANLAGERTRVRIVVMSRVLEVVFHPGVLCRHLEPLRVQRLDSLVDVQKRWCHDDIHVVRDLTRVQPLAQLRYTLPISVALPISSHDKSAGSLVPHDERRACERAWGLRGASRAETRVRPAEAERGMCQGGRHRSRRGACGSVAYSVTHRSCYPVTRDDDTSGILEQIQYNYDVSMGFSQKWRIKL